MTAISDAGNTWAFFLLRLLQIQVLDYPTQQRLLLPLLAHAYALHFAGSHMQTAYHYYLDTQDAAALPDLHATSAGLKALVTQVGFWCYPAGGGGVNTRFRRGMSAFV